MNGREASARKPLAGEEKKSRGILRSCGADKGFYYGE